MVNHCRTLLLNLPDGGDPSLPGEQYIAPDFRPVKLPPALRAIRRLLYGADPDRALLNVRTQRLLTLMHATELDQHVRYLDPRISYLPVRGELALADPTLQVEQRVGTPLAVQVVGELQPHPAGRLQYDISLTLLGPGNATLDADPQLSGYPGLTATLGVAATRSLPTLLQQAAALPTLPVTTPLADVDGVAQVYPVPAVAQLSTPVRLVDAGVTLRWTLTPTPASELRRYALTGFARDTTDLATVLRQLQSVGAEYLAYLFAGDGAYATFRNLWERHPYAPQRLAALATALAYRTEELRIREALAV